MLALVFTVGGLLAAELVAVYLLLADLADLNSNELFAAQGIRHRKNFLRLRLQPDGTLTVYPIGLRTVPGDWVPTPGSASSPGRFRPRDATVEPFLIEDPFSVPRLPRTVPHEERHHEERHEERADA